MTIEFIDLKSQYKALRSRIDERIGRVLEHAQYIMGPEVSELEDQLKAFTQSQHCITVASGTEALLIALMALDIGPGDEVITTPFTFVATAEVIVLLGATPVFVDIEPDTCNLDANCLAEAITPRTKAIIPVSLYGQPCDMDAVNAIAARHCLPVIEDGAQSFGATYQGKRSCNLSTIGCTSFFPSKPLGCYGDGGAIFTNDDFLARTMKEIRVHGQERRYHHTRIGVGGRMDTLQCAIVLAKLERFEWEIAQRIQIGQSYLDGLAGVPDLQLPVLRPNRSSVWGQFTVQVEQRERVIAALKVSGIPTAIHYPQPLHRQPAYAERSIISGNLVNAEAAANRVLSLPMHPYMEEKNLAKIIGVLESALKQ